jgi:ribonuclease Z
MKKAKGSQAPGLTRRDLLVGSGLALGGMALAGCSKAKAAATSCDTGSCYPTSDYVYKASHYSLFERLDVIDRPVAAGELRITFVGSGFPPAKPAQQMMSIFVEVGETATTQADQFVFDCGSGVAANYTGLGIPFARMDKIFLCHLHGDHMSDLTHIYCFGAAADRQKPLYVWGPSASGIQNPYWPARSSERFYDDGLDTFCTRLRDACRWHSESFSFLSTEVQGWKDESPGWGLPAGIAPVKAGEIGDDPDGSGYALYSIELPWQQEGGVAYDNEATGVRITHFPVVHCRKGSMGYKLEWNGLSMIYTSDTRPETVSIHQASKETNGGKGVDVFIHEMVTPPDVYAQKMLRLPEPPREGDKLYTTWQKLTETTATVYESSHTPQGAYGYLLNQIDPHPRLAVATHFPASDDTIECARKSILNYASWVRWLDKDPVLDPGYMTWSFDTMVITVTKDAIRQERGLLSAFAASPFPRLPPGVVMLDPKYPSATAQLDETNVIQSGTNTYCPTGY